MFLLIWCIAITLFVFYESFQRTVNKNTETWKLKITMERVFTLATIWVLYLKLHP